MDVNGGIYTLAFLALTISVVYRVAITISKLVWSDPLGSFSGPLSHRLSEVPRIFHLVRGDLPFHIAKLHAKYGRVVRIGPNQLSFAEPQAWKDIYGHRTGGQAEFSKFPGFYRPDQSLPESIITIHDPTDHAQLRRQLSHGFSEKSLRGQEPIIVGYVDLMVERLYDRTLRGPVLLDMSEWLNWATFDIIGDLGFGSSFGCLEKGDFHPWVRLVTSAVKTATYMQVLVGLGATKMVSWMAFMGGTKAREESRALVMEKLQQRMELGADRPDLFEGLLRMQKEHGMPFPQLAINASAMTIAGSETTATSLCGTLFLLGKNPQVLSKLVDEVRSTFQTDAEITLASVSRLTYMLACLHESLRLYPPVAGGLPRVVPKGGALLADNIVPEGTTVAVWHWAMSRDPALWTSPDEYLPERFMGDLRFTGDLLDAMQPFSLGPRSCLGRNLAYAEMRLILAKLIFNFDLRLAEDSNTWLSRQRSYVLWDKPALNLYLTPMASRG